MTKTTANPQATTVLVNCFLSSLRTRTTFFCWKRRERRFFIALRQRSFLRPRGPQGEAVGKGAGRGNVGQLLQRLRAAAKRGKLLFEKRRGDGGQPRGAAMGGRRPGRRRRLRLGFAASARRGRRLLVQRRKTQLLFLFFRLAARQREGASARMAPDSPAAGSPLAAAEASPWASETGAARSRFRPPARLPVSPPPSIARAKAA